VVDVRNDTEQPGGHIEGSLDIPLTHLDERIGEIPPGRPVAVHCEGGSRPAIAASLLQKWPYQRARHGGRLQGMARSEAARMNAAVLATVGIAAFIVFKNATGI